MTNRDQYMVISKEDMNKRGWEQLDFIIISGDAYIDHPSFGTAIIGRVLEDAGFKVGIIAQPDWQSTADFKKLGKPRLAFLVTAGNMDSMVSNYTVNKRRRRNDTYSPGGKAGKRPDRATIVYCNRLREVYNGIPIVLGGIEASLRRFAHYDYWDNTVRRSILFDSRADLLVYGMGERQILDIAESLDSGLEIKYINHIPGTCFIVKDKDDVSGYQEIYSYEEVKVDKKKYAEAFKFQYDQQDPVRGSIIIQKHGDRYLVQTPSGMPLETEMLDWVYSLPFQRGCHPVYEKHGGVPAIKEVKYSITMSRGCYGACSFCSLTFHQGRIVTSRSMGSIIDEADRIIKDKGFKGYIHDVGGPTANFRGPACSKQLTKGACKNRQCLFPVPCKNLEVDHSEYLDILRALRKKDGVKKVFVRSGLRFDYIIADKNDKFFRELCEYHVSGLLKVAPEHVVPDVLKLMGKPDNLVFETFRKKFYKINMELGKEQYLVPYFISSHPGSTLEFAVELAEYLRDIRHIPEQVQDFYPTPGTLSTTMYYTGYDPRTMEKVFVPKSQEEKRMQRALLQYTYPENYDLVYKALKKVGRDDLIGFHSKALIRPGK